ncbi:unnamed protein product [Adineta ricciae]|uniref:Uncharacterized protein n=2 Tax=Adineta ricciae TaxID=249248 RepID=A0A814VC32_ADIRI|nr:unnamed protein product [Adineta ricciae]
MEETLSRVDEKLANFFKIDTLALTTEIIHSSPTTNDNSVFLCSKKIANESNDDVAVLNSRKQLIRNIQNKIHLLTKVNELITLNNEIYAHLLTDVFTPIAVYTQQVNNELRVLHEKQVQLQNSLAKKRNDETTNLVPSEDSSSENDQQSDFDEAMKKEVELAEQQISHLATESFSSLLILLLKSIEKHQLPVIDQVLTLTLQLYENLPVNYLSSQTKNNQFLFQSLTSLTSYINDLPFIEDQLMKTKIIKILLCFAVAKGSFKDILSSLNLLIFNTTDIFDLQNLFMQLNNNLTKIMKKVEYDRLNSIADETNETDSTSNKEDSNQLPLLPISYLTSINAYPNAELPKIDDQQLTGPFVSSIILTYLDFHNDMNVRMFSNYSLLSSKTSATHFKFLGVMKEEPPVAKATNEADPIVNISYDDLQNWFDLLMKITFNVNQNLEKTTVNEEAFKVLNYVISLKFSSFIDKLAFYHKVIIENRNPLLVKQSLIELNKPAILTNWIQLLCKDNQLAFTILCSFIDMTSQSSSDDDQICQIVRSVERLLFIRLMPDDRVTHILEQNEVYEPASFSSVAVSAMIKLMTYALNKPMTEHRLYSTLIYVYLMTDTKNLFHCSVIQPVFIEILPLVSDLLIKSPAKHDHLYWLLSRMIHLLINGLPEDSLEQKYADKLRSALFSGGCEQQLIINDCFSQDLFRSNLARATQFEARDEPISSEHEFLMSIYYNRDQGAQLISKLKPFSRHKQSVLQKSIVEHADQACAAIFAVYMKYFRRINLAKVELTRSNNQKPQRKLLAIFDYAMNVYNLFATTKGQGGDCHQLFNQIQANTRFLLTAIKESHLIPLVEINPKDAQQESASKTSRWQKEKHPFRLIRNVSKVSNQIRRIMLANRQLAEQNQDAEYVLHKTIDDFIYKTNGHQTCEFHEIIECLLRQHHRASIRLMTYRFLFTLISSNSLDQHGLLLCLLSSKGTHFEWTYFENIATANNLIKEQISNTYYSIIKSLIQSTSSIHTLFHLLNLPYGKIDVHQLYANQFVEILFKTYVASNSAVPLYTKFLAYNWFRLYLLKLCEFVDVEGEQEDFVLYQLVLPELKQINQQQSIASLKRYSLTNTALDWFIQAVSITENSQCDPELYVNQFLLLILRCLSSYPNVRNHFATVDYVEQMLSIYRTSQNNISILLSLKVLRYLLPLLPDNTGETPNLSIQNFFIDVFSVISNSLPEISIELIYIIRTIISTPSSGQSIAIQLIFKLILSNVNLKSPDQIDSLFSCLSILGGCMYPYCLSSIVRVYSDDQSIRDTELAVIIDIDQNALDVNAQNARPYVIQYGQTNKTESIGGNRIRVEVDVSPASFDETIGSIFDALISFIQTETSTIEPLLLIELKRRSIATLYRLLKNKKSIDIFLQKSYASVLAKLSTSDLYTNIDHHPVGLVLSNKRHLEQYCLSLDRCKQTKQIIDDQMDDTKDKCVLTHWNDHPIHQDHLTEELLATSLSSDYQWKPVVSKKDMQFYRHGRIGPDEIEIVPMPLTITKTWFPEASGTAHRFLGRIYLISESDNVSIVTFVLNNLRLSEGKWYYCVRLLEGTNTQIGWATTGFTPTDAVGMGNDIYSWSYVGSENKLLNNGEFKYLTENIRWGMGDVCGCGIEISENEIRIQYWLNGHFLGTAFEHQAPIAQTTTQCNMLPNGYGATYFPGVTLRAANYAMCSCEFIFHPYDMSDCPLPNGYKPLVLPTQGAVEQAVVPYPENAYLLHDKVLNYHQIKANTLLRDYVNNNHLENSFKCDDQQVILANESNGFPLKIDHQGSLTISFDLNVFTSITTPDVILITFSTSNDLSIRVPTDKITQSTRIAIVFDTTSRHIIVYINNDCFTLEKITLFPEYNLSILPNLSVGIKNLAIWKYALTQQHIRQLFTYGLTYVSIDHHRLKEYRKQVNTFTFNRKQTYLSENLYFSTNDLQAVRTIEGTDQSVVEFFGNQTYLTLEKSTEPWEEFTFALDILISEFPKTNEQITLITIPSSSSSIFINDNGYLCLSTGIQSQSVLKRNDFLRFAIVGNHTSLKIFVNGTLEIDTVVDENQWTIKDTHIDLFRETKNTLNNDTLRIACKSLTYLNKAIMILDGKFNSSKCSLDALTVFPYSIVAPSLLLIGYDEASIQSAITHNPSASIQLLDTILREKKKTNDEVLSNFKHLISLPDIGTDQSFDDVAEIIFTHRNDLSTPTSLDKSITNDKKWFSHTVQHLGIKESLIDWVRDKSQLANDTDPLHQLFDFNHPLQDQTMKYNSQYTQIHYSHPQITESQYVQSRFACERKLISIYAHYTILNILRFWSTDATNPIRLEVFGDYTFIITLLKLLDYHYTHTRSSLDDHIDRMSLVITSMLKIEVNELRKYQNDNSSQFNNEIFQRKAPLLYQLQKDMIYQWIRLLSEPARIIFDSDDDEMNLINKQSIIQRPNLRYLIKIFHIFLELSLDDTAKFLIPLLFSSLFTNLLFDIFLLSQTYQTKIFVLHLFCMLLQQSEHFCLHHPIQSFLFRLFLEIPPSATSASSRRMKTFQINLMDIVYLLIRRGDQELDLSPNFKDVFSTIELIDALFGKTNLSTDVTDTSSYSFDSIADQQLMSFLNDYPSTGLSITELIDSLPNEEVPNSNYYKIYPSLSHISALHIKKRCELIHRFNLSLTKVVPILDFNLLPNQSVLIDKIRLARLYILHPIKSEFLNSSILSTATEPTEILSVNFDTVSACDVHRTSTSTMFNQAYEQLYANAHHIFRMPSDHLWRAQYIGMHSTDQGGPYRDSITRICADICSSYLPLFILCPNGRMNNGLNRDRWIPNVFSPYQSIPDKIKKQYQFVGQLMGMAIRRKHYLDLKFPNLLWKQLVHESITLEDIESIDVQSFTMINEIEKTMKQMESIENIDELFSSMMGDLRFEVVSSAGQTYEIIPDGKEVLITTKNFRDYCHTYREYRLNEFQRQIEFIRQGLYNIVPGCYLTLFTAHELEEAVCGKGHIDIELLKRNSSYGGDYSIDSPTIQQFWTVISDMMNEEQKKLFLIFVWGRCTLPNRDEDFTTQFTISPYDIDDGDVDKTLPNSHTCSFALDLPRYSTADIMYERLNYAITYCSSIDGDGMINDIPAAPEFDSDLSASEQ